MGVTNNQPFIDYFDQITPKVDDLLKPKSITITDMDGDERKFTIHRFDAMTGKALFDHYIHASLPKISSPMEKMAITNCIMRHVTVDVNNEAHCLGESPAFTSVHVGDMETLVALESEMLAYNTSFLPEGSRSILSLAAGAATDSLLQLISTLSSEQS